MKLRSPLVFGIDRWPKKSLLLDMITKYHDYKIEHSNCISRFKCNPVELVSIHCAWPLAPNMIMQCSGLYSTCSEKHMPTTISVQRVLYCYCDVAMRHVKAIMEAWVSGT
jgi:hypothetical protein